MTDHQRLIAEFDTDLNRTESDLPHPIPKLKNAAMAFHAAIREQTAAHQQAEALSRPWPCAKNFCAAPGKCDHGRFQSAPQDARRIFTHRAQLHIAFGLSASITRREIPNQNTTDYGLGGIAPLTLAAIVPALKTQCRAFAMAYAAFQALLAEQTAALFPATP